MDLNAALGGTAAGLGGAAAGLGALGTAFAALSSIKAAFFSLLVKPLEIANFVLAIIALAMLGSKSASDLRLFHAWEMRVMGILMRIICRTFPVCLICLIPFSSFPVYFASGEGDLKTLIGTDVTGFLRRETNDVYDSYSGYVSQARALWDTSAVQSLTSLVLDAISKYD